MKSFNSLLTKRFFTSALFLVILSGMISVATIAFAVSEPSKTADTANGEAVALKLDTEVAFEYIMESRNDPFMPFISKKSASANINEILPVSEQLSGMQLFEPGQLTLVAILMVEGNSFAMAEDSTGKGYILNKEMKIGKRGIVTAIQRNKVIIEETAFTRAGKKLTSTIEMLLKKEGED